MATLTLDDILKERGAVPVSDIGDGKELRARRAIEEQRGRAYTDFEWGEARRNLIEFFAILEEWQQMERRRR